MWHTAAYSFMYTNDIVYGLSLRHFKTKLSLTWYLKISSHEWMKSKVEVLKYNGCSQSSVLYDLLLKMK